MGRPQRFRNHVQENSKRYKFLSVVYFAYIAVSLFYIGNSFSDKDSGTRRILTGIQRRVLGQVDIDVFPPYTNIQCVGGDTVEGSVSCGDNAECVAYNETLNICECDKCYENDPLVLEPCSIKSIPAVVLLLLSIFVGECGIDHCVASGCSCPGVCIGITKAFTLSGLGIWYICDVVFSATGTWNERYPYANPVCEW